MCSNLSYAGAQTQMIELLDKLDKNIFTVKLCIFSSVDKTGTQKLSKTNIYKIDIIKRYFKYDVTWLLRLYCYLKYNDIHILYTFLPFANFFGLFVGKIAKVKTIIISERSSNYYVSKLKKYLLNFSIKLSDCIITNSISGRNFLLEVCKQQNCKKIKVVYNGRSYADNKNYRKKDIKKELKLTEGYTTICLVARFKPAKNHRMFFLVAQRLLQKHKHIKFICIGDHDRTQIKYYKNLMARLKKMNIEDNFEFLGFRSDIHNILHCIDIGVLTSNYEGLSNSLIEYMQSGCPVVVTDVSDHKLIIREGINGFVVPPNDVTTMKNKIELLIYDDVLRENISKNNKIMAKELFSIDRMVNQTEHIFRELLKSKLNG